MTVTPRNSGGPKDDRRVMVVLGKAPRDLTDSLGAAGLVEIAHDGDTTIWGEPELVANSDGTAETSPRGAAQRIGQPRLLMTVADAALALGLGRSTVYQLIGRGELEVIHVGRSARIPTEAIANLVDRLRSAQRAGGLGSATPTTETGRTIPSRRTQ